MPISYADFPFLSAILLSCVVGLLAILLTPAHRTRLIKWISAIFSFIPLALSVYLFVTYNKELWSGH